MEPPDWKLPARQYLGSALFDSGNFAEAEKVFLEDLKRNPANGWSLYGLQQTQLKLGKKSAASATLKQYASAWKEADIKLTAARF